MPHDPQYPLQKALYAALTVVPLVVGGQPVSVYEFVPTPAQAPYMLISQQTVNPLPGSARCQRWDCTLLLDIVTSFASKNQVSSRLTAQIAELVLSRLEGQRLPLEGGLQMGPGELVASTMLIDTPTQETVDVHRYLRMRYPLEYHFS